MRGGVGRDREEPDVSRSGRSDPDRAGEEERGKETARAPALESYAEVGVCKKPKLKFPSGAHRALFF